MAPGFQFQSFTFDDSNAFRWGAFKKSATSKMVTIEVEKDAPYTKRSVEVPDTMTKDQMKAFVEAAVAIPQRGAATAFKKPPPKPKPGADVPTDKLGPAVKKPESSAGWLVLVIIGLVALSSSKGRR